MTSKTVFLAAALGIALSSCAIHPPRSASRAKCDTTVSKQCSVEIVAHSDGKYSCALGRFNVNPDVLELTGRRAVDIAWRVSGAFAFCGEGDGIDLPFPLERKEVLGSFFSREGTPWAPKGRVACAAEIVLPWPGDKLPVDSTYAYSIAFRESAGKAQRCDIDPWIWNGR